MLDHPAWADEHIRRNWMPFVERGFSAMPGSRTCEGDPLTSALGKRRSGLPDAASQRPSPGNWCLRGDCEGETRGGASTLCGLRLPSGHWALRIGPAEDFRKQELTRWIE